MSSFCEPVDCVAHQVTLSTGFPRQEYWSGLPFPSSGDLSKAGVKPAFPALEAVSLPLSQWGSPAFDNSQHTHSGEAGLC